RARRGASRSQPRRPARSRQHVIGDAAPHLDAHARRPRRAPRYADPEPRVRTRAHGVRRAAGEAMIAAGPIGLQAAAQGCDEFYFHRRRDLPRWERIGHPLDTLTIVLCLAWLLAGGSLTGYIALAIGSTLFVTKDEGVHTKHCGAGEHWLHAMLFALHPI